MSRLGRRRAAAAVRAVPAQPRAMPGKFDIALATDIAYRAQRTAEPTFNPFKVDPKLMPPAAATQALAMDDASALSANWAGVALAGMGASMREGFIGYPELSVLSLKPEYRAPVEIIAEDSTSEWIELSSSGEDESKAKKIGEIEADLIKFNVRAVLKQASEHDGNFGRAHVYTDLKGVLEDEKELATSISDSSGEIAPSKIGKGKLVGFRTVEPVWVWPQSYNSTDPLSPDWYRPTIWMAMSRAVAATRLMPMVSRPVPDLLKPSFMFGGLSLIQMMKPVVENWLRTRQNVGDAISTFSTNVLATNMTEAIALSGTTSGATANLMRRLELYNMARDNKGLFLIDKMAEELRNVSLPLGGLGELQQQSQEHMCSLARIPVIRLLGIQPAGFNANSDGEIEIYKRSIKSYQEAFLRPALTKIIQIIQINRYGRVDPDIVFQFRPMESLTALEKAELEKLRAETATVHLQNRTISRTEERQRIASDPDTPYDSLDIDIEIPMEPEKAAGVVAAGAAAIGQAFESSIVDRASALKGLKKLVDQTGIGPVITPDMVKEAEEEPPPAPETQGLSPEAETAAAAMLKAKEDGGEGEGEPGPYDEGPDGGGGPPPGAQDEFREADHPRRTDGKFGSGGSSAVRHTVSAVGNGGAATGPSAGDIMMRRIVREKAHARAKEMGFDVRRVKVSDSSRVFTLNGRRWHSAAFCVTGEPGDQPLTNAGEKFAKGDVVLFSSNFAKGEGISATTTHEIQHAKFQAVLDKYSSSPAFAFLSDPQHPVRKKLAVDDGVTPYSTEYWRMAAKTDEVTPELSDKAFLVSVHETLAEIARSDYLHDRARKRHERERKDHEAWVAKIPKAERQPYHEVNWSESEPKPTAVSPTWRKLYDTVNGLYDRLPK